MIAPFVIMPHTGPDYDVIRVVQFTAILILDTVGIERWR
jgi:hypothetical protein